MEFYNYDRIRSIYAGVLFDEASQLVKAAERGLIKESDCLDLPEDIDPATAQVLVEQVDWKSPRGLLRSILRVSRKAWFWALLFCMLNTGASLLSPVLINLFLSALAEERGLIHIWPLGLGLGLCGAVAGIAMQHYFFRLLRLEQSVVNLINSKIFSHTLKLSQSARQKSFVGDIVNHMSTDSDSVAHIGACITDSLMTMVICLGASGLLYYYLGPTAWAAVIILALMIPMTRWVSKRFQRLDDQLMKHRDQRVTLMAQILNAIRLVKYYAWEKILTGEVLSVRNQELKMRRQMALAQMMSGLIYLSVTTIVLFVVLSVHVWRGQPLTAALVFTALALVNVLEHPFGQMSELISRFAYARIGADRLVKFFNQSEVTQQFLDASSTPAIDIEDLTFAYDAASVHALDKVSFQLNAGESLAVVGEVGAGKSTLLQILLGELTAEGLVKVTNSPNQEVTPRIGYVSQEAYILSGTVKDNILFGQKSSMDVEEAVALACFASDVLAMPKGLETEIGEHGVNLSGGQKQRLQLARAVAQDPQFVLLDDPLSAVDPHTEKELVENLLMKHWAGRTRIVVTHRLEHLPAFDKILFLTEGKVSGFGSFVELIATNAQFKMFFDDHASGQGSTHASHVDSATATQVVGEGHLTESEERQEGSVGLSMYTAYLTALGGGAARSWKTKLILLILATWLVTLVPVAMNTWLAWSARPEVSQWSRVGVYGGLALISILIMLANNVWWMMAGIEAGRDLHDRMLNRVLSARLRFYDSTPVGRILQRFSRDMEAADIHLQMSFEQTIHCFINVLTSMLVLLIALPIIGFVIVPLMFFYWHLQKQYRPPARDIKRLDSISRSPRYAHFKETLMGLPTIRAYRRQDYFFAEFQARLARNQRMFYNHILLNRWFSTRIPLIGGLVAASSCITTAWAVEHQYLAANLAGVLVTYSLGFWGYLNWGIRVFSEVEAKMTSIERIEHFSNVETEVSVIRPPPAVLTDNWPSRGQIEFKNVEVRYASHLPLVLKGVSFKIEAGTRVGLVGRTGSGKSTIVQTLFRFMEIESGQILLDGVDIGTVPLTRLRQSIAIIPQDPVLFMGTLKDNLDRAGEHSQQEVEKILADLGLAKWFAEFPKGILTEVLEGGANFSLGERQLICLVRALLIDASVIVLDEATASVDVATDVLLQRVLRQACEGRTMLTIAHRLGTLKDYDCWIELSAGQVKNIWSNFAQPVAGPSEYDLVGDNAGLGQGFESGPVMLDSTLAKNVVH